MQHTPFSVITVHGTLLSPHPFTLWEASPNTLFTLIGVYFQNSQRSFHQCSFLLSAMPHFVTPLCDTSTRQSFKVMTEPRRTAANAIRSSNSYFHSYSHFKLHVSCWHFANVHGDIGVERLPHCLHVSVLEGVDAISSHVMSGVLDLREPLGIGLIFGISCMLYHSVASQTSVGSRQPHSLNNNPVVNVIVLTTPAPVFIGKSIYLQVLCLGEA